MTTAKGQAADARGAPTSGSRGTGPAADAVALGRLEHLYEISKLLADFHGVDETIPRVLEIANDVIPLHGAILIADLGKVPTTLAWPTADPVDERQLRLLGRARAFHAYFAGAGRGTAAEGEEDAERGQIIALPLVVDHQRVFGVLQLEPAALDEASLFFMNALTNQVAVAIDRHRAWQHDRELRHEAEVQRARAQDLEGRHRAVAEALRESEERRRLATEGTGIGTWDYDPATKVSACDATCHALIGLAPEAGVDLDVIVSASHPEDRARMLDALARALDPASGGELDIEHRLIGLLDKVERWVSVRGRAHFEEGRPVRLIGTAVDITARKRAEEALRLSESRFAGIVSLAADAIISSDEAQRITLFNEAAEAMFGYRREEVLGQPLCELLPGRSRAAHDANVERFALDPLRTRAVGGRLEICGRRKNGEEFPAETSISKLAVGGRWIFTVMLRDITAQRRVEEGWRLLADAGAVLAGSLEYDETLTRVAALSVRSLADCCMVDVVGDDGRLRRLAAAHADPAQGELARALSRVQLDRRRSYPAFHAVETQRSVLLPDVPPDFVASIAQDEDHLKMLQALCPRSIMVVPLVARGHALGVMVFVRSTMRRPYDPMDLRTAEELSRHAAFAVDNAHLYRAAQRALRDRDEILGVVAHDLRDPLHAITMAANMLSTGVSPDEHDPARSKLGRILRSTEQMHRLIDDLLDVTRIESGRLSVTPAPHGAGELVAEAADAARSLVSAASLELETAVEEGLPTILVDSDRILQVFSNLISNAVKFTASGGRVRIGAAREGAGVRFWVSDSGAGIAEEALRHIFDRFWQASASDRRGAGLGLPICKGIVEAHGGKLWAESESGRGTTFTFRLPAVA